MSFSFAVNISPDKIPMRLFFSEIRYLAHKGKGTGPLSRVFPRHTLPDLDQLYAILEVIIINNDQHKKTISTNNRNNSKINQHHTNFVDWCYCGREVLFEKVCLFVAHKFVLHGEQFLAKQRRE